jgi:hypothetical protein
LKHTRALREIVESFFAFFAESAAEVLQARTLNLAASVGNTKWQAVVHQSVRRFNQDFIEG